MLSDDEIEQILAKKNAHERDSRITFNEERHEYHVDGKLIPVSISGVWASFCTEHFDAPEVLKRALPKWSKDPKSKYFELIKFIRICMGVSDDHEVARIIEAYWSKNGDTQSSLGTQTHRECELHANYPDYKPPKMTKEFQQYLNFRADHPHLTPYRTEWSVFHTKANVAGQIDAIFYNENTNKLEMIDHKRCANLETTSPFKKQMMKAPFDTLEDIQLSHYYAQQNLYRVILQDEYGIEIDGCKLLQLHPSQEDYRLLFVPDMREQARAALAMYPKSDGKRASKKPRLTIDVKATIRTI